MIVLIEWFSQIPAQSRFIVAIVRTFQTSAALPARAVSMVAICEAAANCKSARVALPPIGGAWVPQDRSDRSGVSESRVRSVLRALDKRDITVPTGQLRTLAIS